MFDLICSIIDIFANLATFKADSFKSQLVEEGQFLFTNNFMNDLKTIVDALETLNIFSPLKLKQDKKSTLEVHPFQGCYSRIMSLISSICFVANPVVEHYYTSPEGKIRLGFILSNTRLDVDNPTLREWCLVTIRNLTSWSDKIRLDLKALELIEVAPEGKKALDDLGMRDVFQKEVDKLKRKNEKGDLEFDYSNVHFE